MDVRDIQRLLAAAGLYKGAIDGDAGPLTMAAVALILGRHDAVPWKTWPKVRQLIAAGQAMLAALGHEPGRVDGLLGPNTQEALTAWASGAKAAVERIEVPANTVSDAQGAYPRQSAVSAFYGQAGGPDCTAGVVTLPIPFRIAWDLNQAVSSFRCHKLVAAPMTRIFREAVAHYGVTEFERLRLNVFGGCYNYRNMRGGSSLSMHAWGIAVDLDPERNQLRWGRDRAAFAVSHYDAFWNIVEAAGATSLGRAANMDWQHFQFARL